MKQVHPHIEFNRVKIRQIECFGTYFCQQCDYVYNGQSIRLALFPLSENCQKEFIVFLYRVSIGEQGLSILD